MKDIPLTAEESLNRLRENTDRLAKHEQVHVLQIEQALDPESTKERHSD